METSSLQQPNDELFFCMDPRADDGSDGASGQPSVSGMKSFLQAYHYKFYVSKDDDDSMRRLIINA